MKNLYHHFGQINENEFYSDSEIDIEIVLSEIPEIDRERLLEIYSQQPQEMISRNNLEIFSNYSDNYLDNYRYMMRQPSIVKPQITHNDVIKQYVNEITTKSPAKIIFENIPVEANKVNKENNVNNNKKNIAIAAGAGVLTYMLIKK